MTTPLTDEEIQRLRELCEKATPGPWTAEMASNGWHLYCRFEPHDVLGQVGIDVPWRDYLSGDAEFIAAARTALPRLLDEVERLKELDHMLAGDQGWVDRCVHYRNLAIMLGAKPNQMDSKYDAALAERGLDEDKEWGDPINGIVETWEELEATEAENARLREAVEKTIEVLEAAPGVLSAQKSFAAICWWDTAKPLLDNLKALRDGGE